MDSEKKKVEKEYVTIDGTIFTRNTLWRNYEGISKPVKELADSHILNITVYLNDKLEKNLKKRDELLSEKKDPLELELLLEIYEGSISRNKKLLELIEDEVSLRELDKSVLDGGVLPFFNKSGNKMFWERGEKSPQAISNAYEYMKLLEEEDGGIKSEN